MCCHGDVLRNNLICRTFIFCDLVIISTHMIRGDYLFPDADSRGDRALLSYQTPPHLVLRAKLYLSKWWSFQGTSSVDYFTVHSLLPGPHFDFKISVTKKKRNEFCWRTAGDAIHDGNHEVYPVFHWIRKKFLGVLQANAWKITSNTSLGGRAQTYVFG